MVKKKISPTMRVAVQNVLPWDIGITLYTQKIQGSDMRIDNSVLIPGDSEFRFLTFEEIKEQILSANACFIGKDGMGTGASLIVKDLDIYKELFECPDAAELPKTLSNEMIINTLNISDDVLFEENLRDIAWNSSYKRAIGYYIANGEYIKNYSIRRIEQIEEILELKVLEEKDTRQYEMCDENTARMKKQMGIDITYLN